MSSVKSTPIHPNLDPKYPLLGVDLGNILDNLFIKNQRINSGSKLQIILECFIFLDTLPIFKLLISRLVFRFIMRVLELVLGVVVFDSDNVFFDCCSLES